MDGDGHRTGRGDGYYATIDENLAKDFQELTHKIGMSCTIKHRVATTRYKKDAAIYLCRLGKTCNGALFSVKNPQKVERILYTGKVYDVTTTSGFFFVRRNGKVSVSGNCTIKPIYRHTDPTSWSQGYAIDLIAKSENFQHIQVPIWDGESLAGAMVERFKG